MTSFTAFPATQPLAQAASAPSNTIDPHQRHALLRGDVLLDIHPYSAWGGAVTATMYIPSQRSHVWQELTNYSQWVKFFPDLVHSEVLSSVVERGKRACKGKRVYQVARKAFLMFSAQVEIYLRAIEVTHQKAVQKIQFQMERGTFKDFSADLEIQDYDNGTLLTYSVKATPLIPIPAAFIQEAIKMDLPSNMKQMRRVICGS
ncbi:MAG: SRPBCC family protein [Leptolyngbyaceae bacterium]|nr:SRPBCC family protein [Leptolyngbyaceae bacterium]